MEEEKCRKCNKGNKIRYILQPRILDGFGSPRVMAKCDNCGQQYIVQNLPMVDKEIEGAKHEVS